MKMKITTLVAMIVGTGIVIALNMPNPTPAKPLTTEEIKANILAKLTKEKFDKSWTNGTFTDELTDEKTVYASSKPAYNKFGNRVVKSYAIVTCYDGVLSSYLNFSSKPIITGDETGNGYSTSRNVVRYGDEYITLAMYQTWGAKSLHLMNDAKFIGVMKSSNSIKVQLNIYTQGSVVFEYDMTGSSKAITKVANECK